GRIATSGAVHRAWLWLGNCAGFPQPAHFRQEAVITKDLEGHLDTGAIACTTPDAQQRQVRQYQSTFVDILNLPENRAPTWQSGVGLQLCHRVLSRPRRHGPS